MFDLQKNKTSVKTEILAGITTFIAMVYILVVNPAILGSAGMDKGAVLAATIWASALMTLSMGLWTNLPLALAPGMGLNAFFTYTLCLAKGIPWQASLGLVFYSGVLFFILTLSGLRKKMLEAVPDFMKLSLTAGIGLFITLIGLKNAGLVVSSPATMITLGSMQDFSHLIVWGAILLAGVLVYKKVPGALLLSMLFITLFSNPLTHWNGNLVSAPPSLSASFLKLDFHYFWDHLSLCLPLVLSLFFVDLFDNMGTLIGVCTRAGLLNEKGELPQLNKALKADAFAAMLGSILGTSSVTSYIESAAGVEQGGRTGLTSVVVAICFLLALFFSPLILMIPVAATTPALVIVGTFMISEIRHIEWSEFNFALPAFVTIIMIPLSFSIAEGFGLGMIFYTIIGLLCGKGEKISWVSYVLSALFGLFFYFN